MNQPNEAGTHTGNDMSEIIAVPNAGTDYVRALQRHVAEAHLRQSACVFPETAETLTPDATRHLVHELRVHQIELDMQNEALRASHTALDVMRERYFDLYDLAPIGYCTVNGQGLIWQANLTVADMFGRERNSLLNQAFSRHIYIEDQDIYYLGRRRLASSGDAQSIELRMLKQDGRPFWVRLTVASGKDAAGEPEWRIVIFDMSVQRDAEAGNARLQQELQDGNAKLERAKGAADHAYREKSDYLLGISRELGIRLDAILILGRKQEGSCASLTPDQKHWIDQMRSAGQSLKNLFREAFDQPAVDAEEQAPFGGEAPVPPT